MECEVQNLKVSAHNKTVKVTYVTYDCSQSSQEYFQNFGKSARRTRFFEFFLEKLQIKFSRSRSRSQKRLSRFTGVGSGIQDPESVLTYQIIQRAFCPPFHSPLTQGVHFVSPLPDHAHLLHKVGFQGSPFREFCFSTKNSKIF